MMRVFVLLALMIPGVLAGMECRALIHHDIFLDDVRKIQKIIAPKSTPVQFFCDPSLFSEPVALAALRMHEITVASIALSRLRGIIPEFKFVTGALDETDLAILRYSLASLGFSILGIKREKRAVYLLLSNLTPADPRYRKITRALPKI
jgi:hypothetical protein